MTCSDADTEQTSCRETNRAKLVGHVNRKRWWHSPPRDPEGYRLRGKFFASTYREAEFYGRPQDQPERVEVTNPLVGDEEAILTDLFGSAEALNGLASLDGVDAIEARLALDTRMKDRALELGHDAIVLMSAKSFANYSQTGRAPRSLELNVLSGF